VKAALIAASLIALSGCHWKPDPITAAARLAAHPEAKQQSSQDQPANKEFR